MARDALKSTWQMACGIDISNDKRQYDDVVIQRNALLGGDEYRPDRDSITWSCDYDMKSSYKSARISDFVVTMNDQKIDYITSCIIAQDENIPDIEQNERIVVFAAYDDMDFEAFSIGAEHRMADGRTALINLNPASNFALMTLGAIFTFLAPYQRNIFFSVIDYPASATLRVAMKSPAKTQAAVTFLEGWGAYEAARRLRLNRNGRTDLVP